MPSFSATYSHFFSTRGDVPASGRRRRTAPALCVNAPPQLIRCDSANKNNWIKIRTIGTKSNRSGIGARIKCVTHLPGEKSLHPQIDEVRSGGGYFSQNDLRVHFGIGSAEKVELLEIRWPSGQFDSLKDLKPNRLYYVTEGQGITRREIFPMGKRS